jgi:hypothetical protein
MVFGYQNIGLRPAVGMTTVVADLNVDIYDAVSKVSITDDTVSESWIPSRSSHARRQDPECDFDTTNCRDSFSRYP